MLESGRLDWGQEVPAFEAEFAAWVGAPFAVTTNSGTAALKVALLALGIGDGDEVITVANTDIASTSAIRLVGAKPVWVDVDPLSLTMDLDAMRAAAGPRTRAILPVDLYGHPAGNARDHGLRPGARARRHRGRMPRAGRRDRRHPDRHGWPT